MVFKSLYPPLPQYPEANVYELFFNNPDQNALPDYTLYVDAESGRKFQRSEFKQRVHDAMTTFGAPVSNGGLGLSKEKGDIIGIYSSNCIDYPTTIISALSLTVPFVPLSSYSTHFELCHLLRTSKCTVLFVHAGLLQKALSAAKEVGLSEDRIFIIEGQVPGRKSLQDLLDETRKRGIPRELPRPAKKDTLAYLMFSSGTTGLPKAVMVSQGNLWYTVLSQLAVAAEDARVLETPPPQAPLVLLGVLPFHHTYGLISFCIRPMNGWATCVVVPRWKAEVVVKAIEKYRVQVLLLVPSMIHQLVHSGLLQKADTSSLAIINSGAAYLPPKVSDAMQKLARTARLQEGYGLSECARLVRDDGTDADIGEPGELWLGGNSVTLGYYNNPKATKESFVNGWLRTGDRFKTDGKGTFFFVDRAKDTLKVSGAQVSPTEIEQVLLGHPGKLISDASVAGVSGGRTSDELLPRAWVVLSEEGRKKGADAVLKELEKWTNDNLSSYKRLRGGLEVVSEIPKSPTGKVLRRVLQDRYEQKVKAKL
ncbi:hypothetical protein QCA50_014584 [Cerrena zonata]|uniref:Acetyl-CoA synthetase-like protein n=1 Tax=Cerrena zonata TaxID=2478898 RepID=A0AAW0FS46_9APHY